MSAEIVEDTSAHLLHLLDEGRLDLAICRTSISQRPHLYDCLDVRDEQLAMVANKNHPLANEKKLQLSDLAGFRWVVYSANMPMRLLLEREFREANLRFPLYLLETTSAFTTLSLLQRNPTLVALLLTDVAQFCSWFGMTTVMPLALQSRSEPYQLVTRKGSVLSPAANMFIEELTKKSDVGENGSVTQFLA